jgi:hypothetical protein
MIPKSNLSGHGEVTLRKEIKPKNQFKRPQEKHEKIARMPTIITTEDDKAAMFFEIHSVCAADLIARS